MIKKYFSDLVMAYRNSAVVRASRREIRLDTPASRNALLKAINRAELYLPTQTHPERILAGFDDVQVVGMQLPDGTHSPVAYTSLKLLREFSSHAEHYMQVPSDALFQMVCQTPNKTLIIDPGTDTACVITSGECESFAAGGVPEYTGRNISRARYKSTDATFSEGEALSPELLNALRGALVQLPMVQSAHYARMQFPDQMPMLVIGFRCSPPVEETKRQSIVETVGEIYRDATGSTSMTFVFLGDNDHLTALGAIAPFYEKS